MKRLQKAGIGLTCFFILLFFLVLIPFFDGQAGAAVAGDFPDDMEILRSFERAAETSFILRLLIHVFALCILLGVWFDIVFIVNLFSRPPRAPSPPPDVKWGLGDVGMVAVVFVLALFIVKGIAQSLFPSEAGLGISAVVATQLLAEIAAIIFLFNSIRPRSLRAASDLGLSLDGVWGHIMAGLKCYIGFLPLLLVLVWITEVLARRLGITLRPQEQIAFFFADISCCEIIFLACFVVFVGPIFEELFFRGFAYQAMRRRLGRLPAIMATAVLFSSLHASFSVFLPIAGLGVLLAYVFDKRRSLVAPIVIHICQNGLAVAGALLLRFLSNV